MIFVTLTYNKSNLPMGAKKPETENDCMGTLKPIDLTNFLKRLRKYISPKKIKYIASGEYGGTDRHDKFGKPNGKWRPHYHLIIYGINNKMITQAELTAIWKKGNAYLDKKPFVNTKAVAYTVGYINKKMTDSHSWEHYEGNGRVAPFQRQSQGLGRTWSEKNPNWYKNLKTGYNGKKCSIPRYYIKKVYEEEGKKICINNTVHVIMIVYGTKDNHDFTHIVNDKVQYYKYVDKPHPTKNYKIFKNPNGTKTTEILAQLHEKALQSLENAKIKYSIPEDKMCVLRAKKAAEMEMKRQQYISEWKDAETLSEEEIQEKYHKETYKIINIVKEKFYIKQKDFDENTYQTMIEQAMKENEKISKRQEKFTRFGEETAEEIELFIEKFKK